MTRLRKLQKTEGQRRSPRLSALESRGSGHSKSHLDNDQGPASRTRGIKKRKVLKPLQKVTAITSSPSPNQGGKHSLYEGSTQNKSDQPSKLSSSTFLPEKRLLELVLDTLQRRDTYEIFAEPVDPNEVQDYYAIIKEPMDFGTMRAKLHEGMYKNLEQFEHDVFLIFNNAMNFNSSGTIYFRQARVINELAKKVFDVLKTDPDKFELEFSETKRKVGRRNQGDLMDSTDMKSSEITIGVRPSKTVSCSSRGTLNRKIFKTNIAKHVDARDVELPTGTKDGRRCRAMEVDRRCTYRPLSLDGEDESIFSTIYGKLKLVEHVNKQDDVGYKDSLMMFVKDLGPTAQNIAKRKLLGCEIRTASTCAPWIPNTFNTVPPTPSLISGNKSRMMMLLANQESSDVSSCLIQDESKMEKSCSEYVLSDGKDIETHMGTLPLASGFVFDLPYLKTRLDQIKSSEQYKFSQQDTSGKKRLFSAQVSW